MKIEIHVHIHTNERDEPEAEVEAGPSGAEAYVEHAENSGDHRLGFQSSLPNIGDDND